MLVLDAGKTQHYGPAAEVCGDAQERAVRAPAPAPVARSSRDGADPHQSPPLGLVTQRAGLMTIRLFDARPRAPLAEHLLEARKLARWGPWWLLLAWCRCARGSRSARCCRCRRSSFVKSISIGVVQHAEGGTVREVRARWSHVQQGEPLLVLATSRWRPT